MNYAQKYTSIGINDNELEWWCEENPEWFEELEWDWYGISAEDYYDSCPSSNSEVLDLNGLVGVSNSLYIGNVSLSKF